MYIFDHSGRNCRELLALFFKVEKFVLHFILMELRILAQEQFLM